MGSSVSKGGHDDSDAATEDKGHSSSGALRGFLKNKSPGSTSSSKQNNKVDESDSTRRMSQLSVSNSSNASDKDSSEHAEPLSPESSSNKPDGITKLAKELILRSQQQDSKDGISLNIFSKYVCHDCIFLGQALFKDFSKQGKSSKKTAASKEVLSKDQFVTGSQKMVQLIGDDQLLSYYIKIFANDEDLLRQVDASNFLKSCYLLSRGASANCPEVNEEVVQTVLAAMFHGKESLSSKYIIHWMEENCPRIVTWMHRHLVHRLTVGFRTLQQQRETKAESEPDGDLHTNSGTPAMSVPIRDVLSFSPGVAGSPLTRTFSAYKQAMESQGDAEKVLAQTHLHPMQLWLLGCTLPQIYTRPPSAAMKSSPSVHGITLTDPRTFITRMVASSNPSNWVSLYNSDEDGLSMNRFEHHVLGYRGPTVTFFSAEGGRVFCLAVDQPWKESIQFWGAPTCTIVQVVPGYRVLDRGEKLVFYNTSVRGYPFGIQLGTDHRNPCLVIDKEFAFLNHRKIPYRLEGFQVFGCGTQEHRELQLEHKKWEAKQVEKSRNVKLSAVDWNDHPDKCLLEMASHRPNYSQFGNA